MFDSLRVVCIGSDADFGRGGGVELLVCAVPWRDAGLSLFLSLGGEPRMIWLGKLLAVKVGPR